MDDNTRRTDYLNSDGSVAASVVYSDDGLVSKTGEIPDGFVRTRYTLDDIKMESVDTYANGMRNGPSKTIMQSPSFNMTIEGNYIDDLGQGVFVTSSTVADFRTLIETNLVNGQAEGVSRGKTFDEKGEMLTSFEYLYISGEQVGYMKFYDKDGKFLRSYDPRTKEMIEAEKPGDIKEDRTKEQKLVVKPSIKTVLLVIPFDGFDENELEAVEKIIKSVGWKSVCVSGKEGKATGKETKQAKAVKAASNIDGNSYDAIIIPGGSDPARKLWDDATVIELVRKAGESGKPVCAVGYSEILVAKAGMFSGQGAAACDIKEVSTELSRAGVAIKKGEVIVSGKVLTAGKSMSIRKLIVELAKIIDPGKKVPAATIPGGISKARSKQK